jgi:DNA modification methylase
LPLLIPPQIFPKKERQTWPKPTSSPFQTVQDRAASIQLDLVGWILLALSREGDWVLDPFLGTGTSIIAALRHQRRGIGAEVVRKYIDLAKSRIQLASYVEVVKEPEMKMTNKINGGEEEGIKELTEEHWSHSGVEMAIS